MSEKKVLNSFHLNNSNDFIESISNNSSIYYLFAAKLKPYDDSSVIDVPLDTESYRSRVYREMVFGKKITSSDVSLVVRKIPWVINTVYSQYDDNDVSLNQKDYYVYVTEGDNYHTFKCLYNNEGAESTVKPDFSAVNIEDELYETSDGYIWKYMYSVDATTVRKFSTSEYFPVVTNTEVQSASVSGAIDVIKVVNGGSNYSNYLAGENTFSANQLRIGSNTRIYDISSNSSASNFNDYYNDCYIYITAGSGVGQYKRIIDYVANSTAKAIVLESEFANSITVDSIYEIYPGVNIVSDGRQITNAAARAIVNAYSNSIYTINMLSRGSGYSVATAYVSAHATVGANSAELRVINSPYNGHGFDAARELGANSLIISVTFANTESNTIPIDNDYCTIGIMRNPLYANVNVEVSTKYGEFINGETVLKINPILINANTTFDADSNEINAVNSDFTNQFTANDFVYISSGTNHHIARVNSISNSTNLILSSNIAFSANASFPSNLYVTTVIANAVIITSNTTNVLLSNVAKPISTGDKFIGYDSKAYMVANSTYISGEQKGFNTFVNMWKLEGSLTSGTFIEDEIVYQANVELSNSTFHSTSIKDSVRSFYLTDVYGDFQVEKSIVGLDSGAVANINKKYEPEVLFKSGDIIYLENIEAVERNSAQSETFKLIFEL